MEESRILSPGVAGSVFNPVVMAEFRRWKARPITYIGIVLLVLFGISLPHLGDNWSFTRMIEGGLSRFFDWGPQAPIAAASEDILVNWRVFSDTMVRLLIRPSTILPLLMVWRALVSFRAGGLYRPFRTTFLTPGEFLWGIISVPFAAAALILVFYVGYMLGPDVIGAYNRMPPDLRGIHPFYHLLMILFEGAANGILICFVALYIGLRLNARLLALGPVIAVIFLIQVPHALFFAAPDVRQFFGNLPDQWLHLTEGLRAWLIHMGIGVDPAAFETFRHGPSSVLPVLQRYWTYLASGIPKIALAMVFWGLSKHYLRERDY